MDELLGLILEAIVDDSIEIKRATPLESTIPDMLSSDAKDRLRAEYKQALIRKARLVRYIKEQEKVYENINLLEEQLKIMTEYIKVLHKRMVKEGVE